MSILKKKPVQAGIAVTLAAAIVLGGTFAWSSFNQSRINVFKELVAPDVNLHDDFEGGPNKDIYVENSGQANIYVRVRLTEFLQTENKGSLVEGHVRDDDKAYLWAPHNATSTVEQCVLAEPNKVSSAWGADHFHDYYTWTMGGQAETNPTAQIYYKPATAEQKGEYAEDGTVVREPVVVSDPLTGTSAAGDASVDYAALVAGKMAELKAADTENKDDDAIEAEALEALGLKKTLPASVITMAEWAAGNGKETIDPEYRAPYAQGNFWVIDEADGWAYWANALPGGETTGLLLDKVTRTEKQFDSNAEYAINAWLQAVDATDFGKFETPDAGGISDNGKKLLQLAAGQIAIGADGMTYANNGDGTYTATLDVDGNPVTDAKAFVPLGKGGVNATERLEIGQRFTIEELAWDGTEYTNYTTEAGKDAPWYNMTKSNVTNSDKDGEDPIYQVTGTKLGADKQTYLMIQPLTQDGDTYIPDPSTTLYLASVSKSDDGAYSQTAPGTAPFGMIWPNANGGLGTSTDGRLDPNVTLENRTFSLLGNGVYLETTPAEGRAAAPVTYFFAGENLTKSAVSGATGTVDEKVTALFPLQLTVGDKFDIVGGTTTGDTTAAVTGYTVNQDSGKYTMTELVKGVNGDYYIYLGSAKEGYVGPGADKFLGAVKDGSVSDARAWDGGMGIGSSTDKATYPGDFAESFLKGKSSADLAADKTFTVDGKTWVVLAVDEYGNRLIMSQNHDAASTFGTSNAYQGSTLQTSLKNFTNNRIPTLKPYIVDAVAPIETGPWSADMAVQEGALSYALPTKNNPTAFILSQSEYAKYGVGQKTPYHKPPAWFWTRTPSTPGNVAVFNKTSVNTSNFNENAINRNNANFPAMWVRFSDADSIATVSQAELEAWKNMPAIGSTLTMDDRDWLVLTVDKFGNQLITAKDWVLPSGKTAFVPNNSPESVYSNSLMIPKLNDFYANNIPTLKPHVMAVNLNIEAANTPYSAAMNDPNGISTCTNTAATGSGATLFPLSQAEILTYMTGTLAQYRGISSTGGDGYWTRSPAEDKTAYVPSSGALTKSELTANNYRYIRPAAWVHISGADSTTAAVN